MTPAIAVLGCGYWGQNHIKTLKALGHLCAVSDIDMDKAKHTASIHNVEAIAPSKLFSCDKIDAIILALPPQFHAENAILAIEHGKDVFIEKPISLDLKQARCVIEHSKKRDSIVMVGHILRFHSAFEELQKQIDVGVIGNIKYINAKRWGFGKFHAKSDAMWDLAPHDLSLMLAIAKQEPTSVNIDGSQILNDNFDFTEINMQFGADIKASLSVSRLSPYCERKFIVVGTKAIIIWDDMQDWHNKLAIYEYHVDEKCQKGECSQPTYIGLNKAMALNEELKHFINCIKTRSIPRTCGEEGVAVLQILNMLHK